MSSLLEPFSGYYPTSPFAHRVVGPPQSMLTAGQRQAASNDPLSFRHAAGRGAGASQVEVASWVTACRSEGALRAVGPVVFVYQQDEGDSTVTGIIADVSLNAYRSGWVKPHERTIAKTERKMANYLRTSRISGNPVALTHRPHAGLKATIATQVGREADTAFTTADGLSHRLWAIEGEQAESVCREFDSALYVMDGHHRLAAASVVSSEEGRINAHVLAGLFSAETLRLRSFARHLNDPALDADAVIDRLRSEHRIEEVGAADARPRERFEYGVKIRDRYFRLQIDRGGIPSDPYESLDVQLLQTLILGPVFGITDARRDRRVRFVADVTDTSQTDVDSDAWFLPFPTAVNDVMEVADSGRVMPAKSTWFAPKIPSGIVIRLLDGNY